MISDKEDDEENDGVIKLEGIQLQLASSGKMSKMSEEDKVADSFDLEVDDMLLSSRRENKGSLAIDIMSKSIISKTTKTKNDDMFGVADIKKDNNVVMS